MYDSVSEGTLLCHLLRCKIMCDFQKWKINATGDIFAHLKYFLKMKLAQNDTI
jgi:hypothetical protein